MGPSTKTRMNKKNPTCKNIWWLFQERLLITPIWERTTKFDCNWEHNIWKILIYMHYMNQSLRKQPMKMVWMKTLLPISFCAVAFNRERNWRKRKVIKRKNELQSYIEKYKSLHYTRRKAWPDFYQGYNLSKENRNTAYASHLYDDINVFYQREREYLPSFLTFVENSLIPMNYPPSFYQYFTETIINMFMDEEYQLNAIECVNLIGQYDEQCITFFQEPLICEQLIKNMVSDIPPIRVKSIESLANALSLDASIRDLLMQQDVIPSIINSISLIESNSHLFIDMILEILILKIWSIRWISSSVNLKPKAIALLTSWIFVVLTSCKTTWGLITADIAI